MLEGRRKSMQPMAQRLGIDHQRLQQFVSTSPWPVEPVRQALATKAIDLITPDAWVVDDTGFVKDGSASPGVARQYSGTLGKVGNVQIGVSVHAVTDVASCPLDWRLFLPASWDEATAELEEERALIRQHRDRALIPAEIGHRLKWELSVDMIDELHDWGVSPPVVVTDAGYCDNGAFRTALTTRGINYVVQVKGLTSVHPGDVIFDAPEYAGCGRPKKPGYRTPPVQAQELAQSLPMTQYRPCPGDRAVKGQ